MAVATDTKIKSTNDPNGTPQMDFVKNNELILNTGSLFVAGKITDNIGGFLQITNNRYDHIDNNSTKWRDKTYSDNTDIRYADRFIDTNRDLIFGVSLNNNPSVSDVWSSAPAWGFNVVPGSNPYALPAAPLLNGGLAQQVVGVGTYVYWNKLIYAEVAAYQTADKFWSFMSQGYKHSDGSLSRLSGSAPYWRIALTKDWGAHNLMLGLMGLSAELHNDATDPSTPTTHYRDIGFDSQYQYILDPHTFSAQVSYIHEQIHYDSSVAGQPGAYDLVMSGSTQPLTNSSDRLNLFRVKGSYVYRATYGGTLSYFDLSSSYNSLIQAGIPGDPTQGGSLASFNNNTTGKYDTRGWTGEVFWIPEQHVRVGLQYTLFSKYLGASKNYDGWGRDAKDNNTLFFYVWGAY